MKFNIKKHTDNLEKTCYNLTYWGFAVGAGALIVLVIIKSVKKFNPKKE